MRYPAKLSPATEGGFIVLFRDIPEAITQGETEEESLEMAADALLTAMDFYFEGRRAVPLPSKIEAGEHWVELPLSVWAKVLLLNEMVSNRWRPADLARAMNLKSQDVSRITDLQHNTKIDTIAEAFKAIGKRLDLVVS